MSNQGRNDQPRRGGEPPAWATDNSAKIVQSVATSISKILTSLFKWAGLAIMVWKASDALIAFAGRSTVARGDIKLEATTHSYFGLEDTNCLIIVGLALLFGLVGIVYGKRQARLRKKAIERFAPNKQMEELHIDPGRSSSKLTLSGETRPEDE